MALYSVNHKWQAVSVTPDDKIHPPYISN
jgi:hypothetical protein